HLEVAPASQALADLQARGSGFPIDEDFRDHGLGSLLFRARWPPFPLPSSGRAFRPQHRIDGAAGLRHPALLPQACLVGVAQGIMDALETGSEAVGDLDLDRAGSIPPVKLVAGRYVPPTVVNLAGRWQGWLQTRREPPCPRRTTTPSRVIMPR